MKINLLINNHGDVRSGYINLDPAAPQDSPDGRLPADLSNLGQFVEANEATEIVAHDILDAFPGDKVDEALDNWVSKLAHGGRLVLSVIDFREVSRSYLSHILTIDKVNLLIHGEGHRRNCSLTLEQLVDVLKNKGLKILIRRVENFRAVVVAERP